MYETCNVIAKKNYFPCIQPNIENVRLNTRKIICIYELKPKKKIFFFLFGKCEPKTETWRLIKVCCVEVYIWTGRIKSASKMKIFFY